MEFLNFFEIKDDRRRIDLCIDIMRQEGLATSIYRDICNALGCFAPNLEIAMFGLMKNISDSRGDGVLTRPGMYYAPNTIRVALVDTYVAAYDHGIDLGIHDMDIMFKAELAHTLIHEISHSMQNTYESEILVPAMEWANEQNVWNNLYPILAPILKKKYKIKLYEETVDDSCGRVFSYTYKSISSYEAVISFLVNHAFPVNSPKNIAIRNMVNSASDVSVSFKFNGTYIPENMRHLKVNGVLNITAIEAFRSYLSNVPVCFEYEFDINTSVDKSKIEFVCDLTKGTYEPLYRDGSPDWD